MRCLKEYYSLLILQLIVLILKLFKSSNTAVIEQCRCFFHIELPSVQLQRRFDKCLANAADYDKVYECLITGNMFCIAYS